MDQVISIFILLIGACVFSLLVFLFITKVAKKRGWRFKGYLVTSLVVVASLVGASFFVDYSLRVGSHNVIPQYEDTFVVIDADNKEVSFGETKMKFNGRTLPIVEVKMGGERLQLDMQFLTPN